MDDHPEEKVREGLREVLNSHGYGFHYAVLRKANELCAKGKSQWYFEAAEYPVSVGGFDTRIDFILRSQDAQATYWDCFLISECKRVDPALSNWVFVRTPHDTERVILEKLLFLDPNFPTATGEPVFSEIKNTYNIGLEVSSGRKGDSSGRGRGQIEEAATQVCKHLISPKGRVPRAMPVGECIGGDMVCLGHGSPSIWPRSLSNGVSRCLDSEISPSYPEFWCAGLFEKTFPESDEEFAWV